VDVIHDPKSLKQVLRLRRLQQQLPWNRSDRRKGKRGVGASAHHSSSTLRGCRRRLRRENGAYRGGNGSLWTLEQPSSNIQIKKQKAARTAFAPEHEVGL